MLVELPLMLSDFMCWDSVPEVPLGFFGTANLGKDEEDKEKVLKPDELVCQTLLLPCSLLPRSVRVVLVP